MNRFSSLFKTLNAFSAGGKIAVFIFLSILSLAIFSKQLARFPANRPSGNALEPPGRQHWLGTDDLGMDLWAQICQGARMTMIVGFSVAFISGIGGSFIGMISGYFGGFLDRIMMRITDLFLTFPRLPTIIVLGAFWGPHVSHIIIVLISFSWMQSARIIRSNTFALTKEAYVIAGKSFGLGFWGIAFRHLLPSLYPLVALNTIRLFSRALVAEASLSFLGFGDPLSKSWGLIIHRANAFNAILFTEFWKWWLGGPLLLMSGLIVSISLIAREIEQISNTKISIQRKGR